MKVATKTINLEVPEEFYGLMQEYLAWLQTGNFPIGSYQFILGRLEYLTLEEKRILELELLTPLEPGMIVESRCVKQCYEVVEVDPGSEIFTAKSLNTGMVMRLIRQHVTVFRSS